MTMMKLLLSTLLLLLPVQHVMAQQGCDGSLTLQVTHATMTWENPDCVDLPLPGLLTCDLFVDIDGDKIDWGVPTQLSRLFGLDPSRSAMIASTSNVNFPLTVTPRNEFSIGTFRHENFPTIGALANVQLRVSLTAIFDGRTQVISFVYNIQVDETSNNEPCEFASVRPCADQILVINDPTPQTVITADGTQFEIDLVGFRQAGSSSTTMEFISQEDGVNSASLYASLITRCPTDSPSRTPTGRPTSAPSVTPSSNPSQTPSSGPSPSPSQSPSYSPSSAPSKTPSAFPSHGPSQSPSQSPSNGPSSSPSSSPSTSPSGSPSIHPTSKPTAGPSETPSHTPTEPPTVAPTVMSGHPSASPTTGSPTSSPSHEPSGSPSSKPTSAPTASPSGSPSGGTSGPTESPSKSPSAQTTTGSPTTSPSVAPTPIRAPSPTGMMGDPHVKNWKGIYFDWMGECDVKLIHVSNFGDTGMDLTVNARTTISHDYSFIETAALRIGEDVLEVSAWGDYALNDIEGALINSRDSVGTRGKTTAAPKIGDYPIFHTQVTKFKHQFDIVLGHDQNLTMTSVKGLVSVEILKPLEGYFGNVEGMLGNYHGRMMARDGVTNLRNDINAMATEWQVRSDEPMLFRYAREPQYPSACRLPDIAEKESRRLGEGISEELAEVVCAHAITDPHLLAACIYDVTATNDFDQSSAYH